MPNTRPLTILHLEDLRSDADLVERALHKSGLNYQLRLASNKKEFVSALESHKPDLILSDHSLPDFSSLEALKLVRAKFVRLPFILITSTVSEEFAVSIMKEGIDDYILKDRLQRLPAAIESAILKHTAETEKDRYLSELLNQKKKFKALIEKSHDCIALLDEHLRTIYISASVYHKIGLEYDEFDQFNGFGQIHPEDEAHIEQTLTELENIPGQSLPITFRSKHKLGHYLWLNGTATNLLQSPEVNAIVINFRDITQNRLAEEELLKTSRHFKALIENITDGIILVNREGAITYTSPSLQSITGLNEKDTTKKAVFDFCHPEYSVPFLEVFDHALNNPRTPQYGALKIRHKNGHYIWVEGTFNNLLDDASVNAIIINFRDITQRKDAEELLKKSQATLLTVVNNAELSYVLLDKKFKVVSFNERAYLGYLKEFKKSLTVGSNVFDYLPADRREKTEASYIKVLANNETLRYETSFLQEDGSTNWYSMSGFPVSDENQDLIGIIISTEDITQRKNAEIEKEKMTSDLIQHNKNLEQFAYIISHNLRAPVANMLGLAYILDNHQQMSADDIQKSLSGLVSSVKRLDEVIIDLNAILQKRRELQEKKEYVNLSSLIEDVQVLLGLPKADLPVEFTTNLTAIPEMFTVKSYLHSIFYNLISNSIKYRRTDRITKIKVETEKKGSSSILRFSDNGMGIDMKTHGDKVFGLYKKFHHHVEGKGMGLYLVKTQVELLGGNIQVQSTVNHGVTFTIEFHN